MPLFFSHYPDFTPVKVMLHYGQMLKTGRFSYYDYGTRENVVRYGPIQVPEYPVGNIQVPVHMFAGRNDFLSDLKVGYCRTVLLLKLSWLFLGC